MDAGAIAFGSALLGAIVGGLLSLAGSVWVGRLDVMRTTRIRMLEELMPPLLSFVGDPDWPAHTQAQPDPDEMRMRLLPLVRASASAGRRDRHMIRRIMQLVTERQHLHERVGHGWTEPDSFGERGRIYLQDDQEAIARDLELLEMIWRETQLLQNHLEQKIL